MLDQGSRHVLGVQFDERDFADLSNENYPSLVGICSTPQEEIYFSDSQLNKIFTGRTGEKKFYSLNDTLVLRRPTGIAYYPPRQELWVVETTAHRLTVLDRNGKVLRHLGKRGNSKGEFNFPTFLWIDKNGLVYIVDSMNFRVQVMNIDGQIVSCFGEAGDATGFFARPKGIATDTYGNIYVVDALFHTVQIFDREGQFLLNFGEQGSEPGQFWLPVGIYIDDYNKIYVADSYNSRIQVFQLIKGGQE